MSHTLNPLLIRFLGSCVLALVVFATPARLTAQQVGLQVDADQIYADMPFVLSVVVKDFQENPEPTLTPPQIDGGADVTLLGVSPNVSSMISIVNGRRTERRDVSFVYRYRVVVPAAGTYSVSPVTAVQGTTAASSQAATFSANVVQTTHDMRLQVATPKRPLWIGETFELSIDWYLRKDVKGQTFVVPLFVHDAFEVRAPEGEQGPRLAFDAGARPLELPYTRDKVVIDGESYAHFRFRALLTPTRAGTFAPQPARVMANLQTGVGRDRFGFRTARTLLYQATDSTRQVEVRPLPLKGRPAAFANAIGSAFSIAVEADRTVVKAGDPVELTILVRGEGRLAGLMLPPLDAAGLSPDLFSLPATPPAGEPTPDGNGRIFRVSVRVKSPRVTEIPPLAFGSFDPKTSTYQTVRSEPIALSVASSNVVGARDVVSGSNPSPHDATTANGNDPHSDPSATSGEIAASTHRASGVSLVGADLGLSEPGATLTTALLLPDITWLLALLYLLPLAILGWQLYRRSTRAGRTSRDTVKKAREALEDALEQATTRAARDAAPPLVSAVRALARACSVPLTEADALLEHLETVAFDPRSADAPLDASVRDHIKRGATAWLDQPAASKHGSAATATAALIIMLSVSVAAPSPAAATPSLEDARQTYQEALAETDRAQRTARFARTATMLAEVADDHPTSPELLVDWGNAALGAQDMGYAVLAYRRALHLDTHNARAQRNLEWVRSAQPEWLPRRDNDDGAAASLMFWNRVLARPMRAGLGALAFAIGILLLAPWGFAPLARRTARLFAVGPFLLWIWLSVSLLVDHNPTKEAVLVVDGTIMRSADSPGAAPALSDPLPAGAEFIIVEQRETWTRIELGDGRQGWVTTTSIARVQPG